MTAERYEGELPMDRIVIGKGQVRLKVDRGMELDELAKSIQIQGLLEPIVVCPSEMNEEKYEVIAGQRRFLACQNLGHTTIKAMIHPRPADLTDRKALSLTENLLRTEPPRADTIDACTELFQKYGSVKLVSERTGIPERLVREYVKVARLIPELQSMVKDDGLDIKVALRAQDAASAGTGIPDPDESRKLAMELSSMSGAQQNVVVQKRLNNPDADVDEVIESAKTGAKVVQIVVTMSGAGHAALKNYAKQEGTTLDDAARSLIEHGLSSHGLSEAE